MIALLLGALSTFNTSPVSATTALAPPLPSLQAIEIDHPIETLNSVTTIIPYTDNSMLVSEQSGRIYVFKQPVAPNTEWEVSLFLDLRSEVKFESELGFYGIAFSPLFATNHTLYLSYINLDEDLVVDRYQVVTGTRTRVITIPKPDRPDTEYHRGGQIEFYNGLLYISTGDGAIWEPLLPGHPSQNLDSLLGKILRIDVETGNPATYTIPADNPFVGLPNHRPEIWAYGLRNPYKFAFDSASGDMYIADVGNAVYEEINLIGAGTRGQNFGWRCYEGPTPFPFSYKDPACPPLSHTPPCIPTSMASLVVGFAALLSAGGSMTERSIPRSQGCIFIRISVIAGFGRYARKMAHGVPIS